MALAAEPADKAAARDDIYARVRAHRGEPRWPAGVGGPEARAFVAGLLRPAAQRPSMEEAAGLGWLSG